MQEEVFDFDKYDQLPEAVASQIENKDLVVLIRRCLHSCRIIGDKIRNGHFSSKNAGTQNAFGDHQLDVDIQSENVIMENLRASGLVKVASSEENPVETDCGGSGFSVAFDPLDGSSIVDANFAVGTIIAIFASDTFLNKSGLDLAASMMCVYGPRVTVALALPASFTAAKEAVCLELSMFRAGWDVSCAKIQIRADAKTFAPGNLRATLDNARYAELVRHWMDRGMTLRYSGGLVPDVNHMLIKGEGVFSNACSPKAKAKLRLLYEAIPIALLVEAAGGQSCVSACEAGQCVRAESLLRVPIDDLDKRVGVCYGSSNEVQRFIEHIFE